MTCPCCAGLDVGDVLDLCRPCDYMAVLGLPDLCRHDWPSHGSRPPSVRPARPPRHRAPTWRPR